MAPPIRVCLLFALAAAACTKPPGAVQPPEPHEAPSNRIAVPATVRENLGITFVKVERRRVAATLRVPGHFELSPTARQELRTPVPGRVTLLVSPLQTVAAGDVVYRVDSPEWRALQRELAAIDSGVRVAEARLQAMQPLLAAHQAHEQSLREAAAVLEKRQQELEATQTSVGGQARDLAEVRAQLAQVRAALAEGREKEATTEVALLELRARIAADRERFLLALDGAAAITGTSPAELLAEAPGGPGAPRWRTLATIDVRAGAEGTVDSLLGANGAWVETGQLVATVGDLAQVRFRARGLQSDLPRLLAGQPAQVVPARGLDADGARVPGTLLLGAEADPAQRTIELFLAPTAATAWARPGVAGFLEIETAGAAEPVLAIPRGSVLQDGLERVLFRRDPKNPDQVIRCAADLGVDDGRWVEVKSGLVDGDEIVLAGAYELVLASSATAGKGGHFHADGTFHADEDK